MSDGNANDGTFAVSVWGQVEWIEIPDVVNSPIFCRFDIVYGADWSLINGLKTGISQTATSSKHRCTINLPIEILLQSTNPHGWPIIVLSCYNFDRCIGVGQIFIPISPCGPKTIEVNLSRPCPTTLIGRYPEMRMPRMLAEDPSHTFHQLRMESCGVAELSLNVAMKGFKSLGYDSGS